MERETDGGQVFMGLHNKLLLRVLEITRGDSHRRGNLRAIKEDPKLGEMRKHYFDSSIFKHFYQLSHSICG